MIHSIRGRLTLWYSTVLAIFLGGFSVAVLLFLRASSTARIDELLSETASAVAGAMEFERGAGKADTTAIADVVRSFPVRHVDVMVFRRADGVFLHARNEIEPQSTPARVIAVPPLQDVDSLLAIADTTVASVRTVRDAGDDLRLFTLPYRLGRHDVIIAAVQSLAGPRKSLREAAVALMLGVPVLLALATAGGYLLARQSLSPVAAMTERAAAIGASSLHERLPVDNPRDELGRLAAVFNELLDRLEQAFENQRRFMADASHELRTPVAVISGESELALSKSDRPSEELRDALRSVQDESRRLRDIVQDLFLLARSEAGERTARADDLYLRDVLSECVRSIRTVAAAKGVTVTLAEGPGDMPAQGDEALLKRLTMNLLDNAVKYTSAGGHVTVSARTEGDRYLVDVTDTGGGIPEDARARIFDRFYRAPGARAHGEGAGLGLAIARSIARAHGGELTLERSSGEGSVFRFTIPAAVAAVA